MLLSGSFLLFTLLYLLDDRGCQTAGTGHEPDENIRPSISNTSDKVLTDKISYFLRYKRKAKESSLHVLRNKINEEKRREQEQKVEQMVADAHPRIEPNFTTLVSVASRTPKDFDDNETGDDKDSWSKILNKTSRERENVQRVDCNFESTCAWTWRKDIANGFFITGGAKLGINETGPKTDANGKDGGDYLLLRPPKGSVPMLSVSSPPLSAPTTSSCQLNLHVWQSKMKGTKLRVVASNMGPPLKNHTEWQLYDTDGDDTNEWQKVSILVGRVTKNFSLIVEVVLNDTLPKDAAIAFDNIQLYQCYVKSDDSCTPHQYRCNGTTDCINSTSICDITEDCPVGDDEKMETCGRMPFGARCTFEDGWCGWENVEEKILNWSRHNGSTPNNFTGPNFDHTYMNKTGNYLYVNMLKEGTSFASAALLKSVIFNPPPRVHGNSSSRYYNSCAIRFYLHKTGKHKSAISLQVTELRPSETVNTEVLWNFMNDHGDQWVRQVKILPNVTHKYYLAFEAKKGFRYMSDIAIDDVSLSPECFGYNIPPDDLNGYNYWNPRPILPPKETHTDFKNKTYYKIGTCNVKGRFGPTQTECQRSYNNTKVSIKVMHEPGMTGVQKWNAPTDGFYTFILAGASGGRGSSDMGQSRGAMVRTVFELKKGQEIFMLVGQEGSSACVKTLSSKGNSTCYSNEPRGRGSSIRSFLTMEIFDSGGGGGGATFLFMRNRTKDKIPLAVAAGGGGLGILLRDNGKQHGQGFNFSVMPVTGSMYGLNSAGAGGGWTTEPGIRLTPAQKQMVGGALTGGGIGGKACYNSTDGRGDGGFGGGGGGCKNGGGGGGYAGGNAINTTCGEGGYSFLNMGRTVMEFYEDIPEHNQGPGYVLIIPATEGCNCDFRCAALDAEMSTVACICPRNWKLDTDMKTCIPISGPGSDPFYPTWLVLALIITILCLTIGFGAMCFLLYNRYQQRKSGILRRKIMTAPELQLNRIRMASDSMMTEYNPNYEFGGTVYTLKDLKDIPRDQLRLVKALGQGAFGEVYQGFYRQRPVDIVEMPVAVKTLPEMSTAQAEMDFLMEALIMSKFNHTNIVHFIGVCFDKHPRFIVLELLAGGDLKNFLRESRPKPERASSLSMKDLILIAVDVAKGCKYLEDNRFIHRDIAARNCLLTTKGPGRVVKIADFGMSRDVYRSDYYRKGGKAMLPIKWMPPEAFLDGIFTSKTDVWSFGVLLWEILKMGYMPYTGCTNREVMDLVVQGGRLEQPENCPGPIYGIMTQCWHPKPEMRPNFMTILERLGYCTQDPDVMNAPLPIFHRLPSNERDMTVMRPQNSDETCLQVIPNPSDYLIPNHTTPQTPDPIESTSSVEKLLPDNSDSWETSFILPNSRSTQPLLIDTSKDADQEVPSVDQLLTIDNVSHQKLSPVPSHGNHNNNAVNSDSSLKSGLSLDAGALAKQAMTPGQKKKYANINPNEAPMGNGVVQNGGTGYSLSNRKSDTEIINC